MVLEMIGDLPEADSKPPTNMLFVCKLNQVLQQHSSLSDRASHVDVLLANCTWRLSTSAWLCKIIRETSSWKKDVLFVLVEHLVSSRGCMCRQQQKRIWRSSSRALEL